MRAIRVASLSLLLLSTAVPAMAHGLAFVLNSGGASISVVDMTQKRELRRIPVLREPHHLALSPDGKELLVGDTVGNEMLFLDPLTGEVTRRLPVADPYQLGFSPNGKWLTVNGLARNQVDIYEAATMQLVKRFPLASMPSHLAYAPDSQRVFVSLQGTNRLAAIDLTDGGAMERGGGQDARRGDVARRQGAGRQYGHQPHRGGRSGRRARGAAASTSAGARTSSSSPRTAG